MLSLPPKVSKEVAEEVRNWARMYAPGPDKSRIATGELRSWIVVRKGEGKNKFEVHSEVRSPEGFSYGIPQETGSKSRKGNPLMKFKDSRTGEWVTKREVAGIGRGEIGARTVHHFTRGFKKVMTLLDKYGEDVLKEQSTILRTGAKARERKYFSGILR